MRSKKNTLFVLLMVIPTFMITIGMGISIIPALIIASVIGIYFWLCYIILILTKGEFISVGKLKPVLVLLIYFLGPLIALLFYWLEKGDIIYWIEKPAFIINSVLGIFAYVWMCFNILIIIKAKFIEKSFGMRFLTNFHTVMSTIALFLGAAHGLWLTYLGTYNDDQFSTGTIGLVIFIVLMALALIFMTNRFIRSKKIMKFRVAAYKRKFRYEFNKLLHNFTILAVFFIFLHTLISYTALSSKLMQGVYFFFFIITLIGWVSHKVVRRLRIESDPYIHRKGSWDTVVSKILKEPDEQWTLQVLKEVPSLYVCMQCGTCTEGCPVAPISNGRYNPRHILEKVLLGQKKILEEEQNEQEENVWLCSTCQKCVEQCPQKIKVTDILSFIKNRCYRGGYSTEGFKLQAKMIFDHGLAIPFTSPILKRREQLGLSEMKVANLEEIQSLMKEAGLDLSKSEEVISKK